MSLFQKAPVTEAELARGAPLTTPPDQVLLVSEQEWYERIYRGDDVAQLTVRAALMGSVLGFFLAFTNVYIGLKTGWHLGVSITAGLISFASWSLFVRAGVARSPMTILETNCMQSTASAAGYATGGTLVSAFPALLMLSVSATDPTGRHSPVWITLAWTFLVGVLGTVLAVPLKRSMINHERLRFPTGVAAAVTLHGLYSHGAESARKARALLWGGAAGALVPLLKDLPLREVVGEGGKIAREALIPSASKIFDFLPDVSILGKRYAMSDFNIKLDHGVALVAAGAIVGIRVTSWMMIGGLVLAFIITPIGMDASWTNPAGNLVTAVSRPQTAWKELGLWLGAPLLVSSALFSFLLRFRTIVRAFSSFAPSKKGDEAGALGETIARTEVPSSWFMAGTLLASVPLVWLAWYAFHVPIHLGVLAVAMTFVLCVVASRATGESDVTPTGAMGKIMQLTYGTLIPQNVSANLMTAAITSGSASASADLLTDLKAGYLLGANPRRQFIAQLCGVVTGTFASVIGYHLLVPDARALTGVDGMDPPFPAPAAQQWKAVAEVFRLGFENFHPLARQCIIAGAILGVLLVILERSAPARVQKWMPNATGLGIGFILPFYYPLAMFLGAVISYTLEHTKKTWAERYIIPVASGLIAGESILGVIVAALNNFVMR